MACASGPPGRPPLSVAKMHTPLPVSFSCLPIRRFPNPQKLHCFTLVSARRQCGRRARGTRRAAVVWVWSLALKGRPTKPRSPAYTSPSILSPPVLDKHHSTPVLLSATHPSCHAFVVPHKGPPTRLPYVHKPLLTAFAVWWFLMGRRQVRLPRGGCASPDVLFLGVRLMGATWGLRLVRPTNRRR